MIRPVRVTQRQFGKVIEVPEGDEVISIAVGAVGGRWSPTQIKPRLAAWLDATQLPGFSNGASVPQWTDVSGNGRHFVNATPSLQPTYQLGVAPNGGPALLGDGVGMFLQANQAFLVTPLAILFVTKSNLATQSVRFLGGNENFTGQITWAGNGGAAGPTVDPFTATGAGNTSSAIGIGADWHAVLFHNQGPGANDVIYVDGNLGVSAAAGGSQNTGRTPQIFTQQATGGNWPGYIAEVVYVQNPTASDIASLRIYPRSKWRTP